MAEAPDRLKPAKSDRSKCTASKDAAEAGTVTGKGCKSKPSAVVGEGDVSPPAKKARKAVGASTSKLSLASSSSSSLGASTRTAIAPKIRAGPLTLTKDLIQAAHNIIDLAKSGSWVELFSALDKQPELVNVRPEVRDYGILHQAAYNGQLDALENLLNKYGADPSQATKHGQSAIDVAKEQGQTSVVKRLSAFTMELAESSVKSAALTPEKVEKGAAIELTHVGPMPKLTPDVIKAAHRLIDHAKEGQWQELFKLLDKQPKGLVNVRPEVREFSALHQAAFHDNEDVVLSLIRDYGADSSLTTSSGLCLLEVAKMQGCNSVVKALDKVLVSAATHNDEDMTDDDFEIKQMPDGSWKVKQKSSSESLDCAAVPSATPAKPEDSSVPAVASKNTGALTPKPAAPGLLPVCATKSYPVDWLLPNADKCRVYRHEGATWHCMLKRANQFYLMQLVEINLDSYCIWTRWGKIDTDGEHEATYFASPELAAAAFKAKFYDKTSNKWENRKSFKQFFGKYVYKQEAGIDDDLEPASSSSAVPIAAPSLTSDTVQQAHKLIDFAKAGRWPELFEMLEAHKTLVNARPDVREFAVLHQAAFQGKDAELLRLINECGADPSLCTKFGKSPADIAQQQGFLALAEKVRSRVAKAIAVAGGG